MAVAFIAQPCPAVATDIEQCAHRAVIAPHQNERLPGDFGSEKITGRCQHAGVSDAVPMRRHKVVHVISKKIWVGVEGARQRMARSALRQRGAQPCAGFAGRGWKVNRLDSGHGSLVGSGWQGRV